MKQNQLTGLSPTYKKASRFLSNNGWEMADCSIFYLTELETQDTDGECTPIMVGISSPHGEDCVSLDFIDANCANRTTPMIFGAKDFEMFCVLVSRIRELNLILAD